MAKKAPRKAASPTASPVKPKLKAKSSPGTPDKVDSGVSIRMYCHGLGDCFLLSFPPAEGGGKPVRVMIDCGILQHAPGEASKLRAVAQNLLEDTEGFIDLLVVTHEHWDHVAGFSHAKDLFEKIEFGQVWLSWAESPNDSDARVIKGDLGKKRNQLHAALKVAQMRMGAVEGDPSASPMREDVLASENILAFFGPIEPEAGSALAVAKAAKPKGERKMSLGESMDWLRAKVKPKNFCSPGECRALPGAEGVKVYVMGPPRDAKMLRKMDPTGDQGYALMADRVSLFGAIADMGTSDPNNQPASPFDRRFRVSLEEAARDPFFQSSYGFPNNPLGDPGSTWRRIDNEWLVGGLSRLALQLDVGVNNTSLALVFELPDGRTLIFPGDAQMGNWMSWDSLTFKDEAGKALGVTSKDLLNRAVFYKVGHHGSHNATRKVGGLEEMKSGDLVVMIPTDEKFALTQSKPHGWKMPAHGVNEALKKFSNNRILRADRDQQELDDAPAGSWGDERKQVAFADKTFGDDVGDSDAAKRPIWVEYTVVI